MISTEQVKALRDQTGVSIMQCKKALEEAKGDMDKATVILRKQSGTAAAKKADRAFGAGVVQSYIHSNNEVGAVVVLLCETDFVSKNEAFSTLAYNIAMHVAASSPMYKSRDEIDDAARKAAHSVFAEEVKGKPEKLQKQILEGKLDAYFKDKILLEQPYIKDPDRAIKELIDEAAQKFGERIEIGEFARYTVR